MPSGEGDFDFEPFNTASLVATSHPSCAFCSEAELGFGFLRVMLLQPSTCYG